ncbi:hypothetical protein [Salinibaculum rarum]|uniref:hypothetical protein n=1 Tax=Salinibaculum rarum TaxID=3058903 RepID=UPI00265FD545|nr:hypothetical protein [Salinibaculum sp. KK48]
MTDNIQVRRLLLALSLASLVALGGALLAKTNMVTVATVFTAAVILSINTLFYYAQAKRRGDFVPLYPDMGIAIFFSMTALNALLLFFRTHGSNPFILGLYFPAPLPKALILRALVIVACANLLFIITFYSQLGPTLAARVPDPPTTTKTEQTLAKYVLIPFLLFGVTLAFLGLEFSGPLFVVARNFLYALLPLLFVVGVYDKGVLGWPTAAALGTIAVLLLDGHLSYVIVPVLGLMVCYHFLYRKLKLLHIVQFGTVFVAIAIFGKQYRLRSTLPLLERIQESFVRMIITFPSLFANNVIARLSPFESFVTVIYFVNAGEVDLLFGRQYPAFIGKLLPQTVGGGDTYFAGGYYTNILLKNNIPPELARFIGENTTASLGAFGSWYLNFHLIGIVVGIIIMGVIFRIWTELLDDHTDNMWVVAFHATNVWYMYSLWSVNTRTTRALLMRTIIFAFVFYTVRYFSHYMVRRRASIAK